MNFVRRLLRWMTRALLGLLAFSLAWVLVYRFAPPPATYLMLRDRMHGLPVQRIWRSLDDLGKLLPLAAIAAEDARFCSHHGFDVAAINQALKANERARERGRSRLRGGSTISQQTAKNAFLWPQRSWLRKGLESGFTVLIELAWPKKRIMEVYLNIAEWGPGIFGAEAAAQYHFHKPAQALSAREAALLAVSLPNPFERQAGHPGAGTQRLAEVLQARMRRAPNVAACARSTKPR